MKDPPWNYKRWSSERRNEIKSGSKALRCVYSNTFKRMLSAVYVTQNDLTVCLVVFKK